MFLLLFIQKIQLFNIYVQVFSNWFMLDWDSRCKISLGILEFFLDAVSFNSNNEFGDDSLYLCSPIEASFGYNRLNEAKLVNYEHLFTGKQLQARLSSRFCKSDLDCVYSEQCSTTCDVETNTCGFYLTQPQIVNYCAFIHRFLNDNVNMSETLNPLLKRCLHLRFTSENNGVLFDKNEIPVSFKNHRNAMSRTNYWQNSLEFVNLSNELYNVLWERIKFLKDPEKPKKKAN